MARVYVSCAEQDLDLSARIKDWLRFQDYEPVSLHDDSKMEKSNLAQWHREFAQTLEHCDLVILVLTPNWADSKWCFAEFTEAYSIGKTILAVVEEPLNEPFSEPGIPLFDLTQDRDQGLSDLAAALRGALSGAGGGVEFDPDRPIYPGLKSFEERDGAVFFCREDDARRIIDRLNTRRRQGGARLIALLGAPGTGISSLLQAGVLPRIVRDQEGWIVLPVMRPTLKPIDEFSKTIARLLGNYDLWQEWAELFRGNDFKGVARELADQLRDRFGHPDAHILLPIDQAEELFSIADPDDAEDFLNVLGAIFDDDMPYVGIAALRPDFLERFQTADQLSHVIEEFSPRLMPLSSIREIITKPADIIQLNIEEELVEAILNDALEEGALPLVAVVLRQLYQEAGIHGGLTFDAYQEIGTEYAGRTPLGNIIARLAEGILQEEQPSEAQLLTIEEVFSKRLVWRDNDNRLVARPVALDDLNLKTRVLIRKFIEAGLLVPRDIDGYEMVEYAHLSIIDHWPRVKEWLNETDSGDTKKQPDQTVSMLPPPGSEAEENTFKQEPEEISETSYRFDEDERDKSGFIDEAHNFVQGEILGPEKYGSDINEEDERLSVPPSIFSDNEGRYETPSSMDEDRPSFMNRGADEPEQEYAGVEYIPDENVELESREKDHSPYDNQHIAPRAEGFESSEEKPRKGSKLKALMLGSLLAISVSAGVVFWPKIQKMLPEKDIVAKVDNSSSKSSEGKKETIASSNPEKEEPSKESVEVTLKPEETEKETASQGAETENNLVQTAINEDWPMVKLARYFEILNDPIVSGAERLKTQTKLSRTLQDMKSSLQLNGHEKRVRHVGFSPDGQRLATASDDATVRVWDLMTGNSVAILKGHEGAVNSVSFSSNGKFLASASADKTIKLWDVEKGTLVRTFEGHKKAVKSVVFNPAGDRIATASDDREAKIWDVRRGTVIFTLSGHKARINSVVFSNNGSWIATASQDQTARIWDASSGQQMLSLEGHKGGVRSVKFSNDSSMVVTGSEDKTVRTWRAFSGKSIDTYTGHLDSVVSVDFSPDEKLIISTADDGKAIIWNLKRSRLVSIIKGKDLGLANAVFSQNGDWIAAASKGNIAHILPAQLYINNKIFEGHTDRVFSGVIGGDNELVVTSSRDNTARVWNIDNGAQKIMLGGHHGKVHHSIFSPDQETVATASKDGSIRLWNIENGRTTNILASDFGAVNKIAYSSDGKYIVGAYQDKVVQVWDVESGEVVHQFSGHTGPVWSVKFSVDDQKVYSSSSDGKILIWDMSSGEQAGEISGVGKSILSIAISPDGKTLMSGSVDGVARFWDLDSQEQVGKPIKHGGIISAVAFSADGETVLTAGFNKKAFLWHRESGDMIWEFKDHEDRVLSVSMSEAGNWVLTTSADKAHLWRVFSQDEMMFYVKTIIPRCLATKERQNLGLISTIPSWCKGLRNWQEMRK